MVKGKLTQKELRHDGLVDAVSATSLHLQKYSRVYISLAALLVIAAIIIGATQYQKASRNKQAGILFSRARSMMELRQVYEKYDNTPSAPLALMLMAGVHYRDNQPAEAEKAYQLFLEGYPRHQLAPFAQMGIACCRENRGDWEEAIIQYRKVGQNYPQSSLAAAALFGIGRCQRELEQPEEAINAYRELISIYPRSLYARLAQEQMVVLMSRDSDND